MNLTPEDRARAAELGFERHLCDVCRGTRTFTVHDDQNPGARLARPCTNCAGGRDPEDDCSVWQGKGLPVGGPPSPLSNTEMREFIERARRQEREREILEAARRKRLDEEGWGEGNWKAE